MSPLPTGPATKFGAVDPPDDQSLLGVLRQAAGAVRRALDDFSDWRAPGKRRGQYGLDLVADAAAVSVLQRAGLRVLSEESGTTVPTGDAVDGLLAVVDPVDGSTNASLGLPWYATSICLLDTQGPRVALVVDQANGTTYETARGAGAWCDGQQLVPSGRQRLAESVIGVSGLPRRRPGWAQYRAMGAAALDLCAVARGWLDGFMTVGESTLNSWDYLGGMLVCTEAGAVVGERSGQDTAIGDDVPRRPLAAATPELLAELLELDV